MGGWGSKPSVPKTSSVMPKSMATPKQVKVEANTRRPQKKPTIVDFDGSIPIGIDLGTTFCVASYVVEDSESHPEEEGQVRYVNFDTPGKKAQSEKEKLSMYTLPSWIAVLDPTFNRESDLSGQKFGYEAQQHVAKCPADTTKVYYDMKRMIGLTTAVKELEVLLDESDFPFGIEFTGKQEPRLQVPGRNKAVAPEVITSLLLRFIAKAAEQDMRAFFGKESEILPVKNVVITVPAYFNEGQREATRQAAELANLNVVKFLSEPIAASIAVGMSVGKAFSGESTKKEGGLVRTKSQKILLSSTRSFRDSKNDTIVVFDFGGGTHDVALVCVKRGRTYKVRGTSGDTHLGGQDITESICKWALDQSAGKPLSDDPFFNLNKACNEAKIALTSKSQAQIEGTHLVLTKKDFEGIIDSIIPRLMKPVHDVLKSAKMKAKDVDQLVLCGGSTKIPAVQQALQQVFGKKIQISNSIDVDLSVSYGAAITANMLANTEAEIEVRLEDVTPMTIGVEGANGKMIPIIPAGTPTPCALHKVFNVHRENDGDDVEVIKIFQGQGQLVSECKLLGDLRIELDYDTSPQVSVNLDVDEDNLLTVTVTELATHKSISSELVQAGAMSEEEKAEMQ